MNAKSPSAMNYDVHDSTIEMRQNLEEFDSNVVLDIDIDTSLVCPSLRCLEFRSVHPSIPKQFTEDASATFDHKVSSL